MDALSLGLLILTLILGFLVYVYIALDVYGTIVGVIVSLIFLFFDKGYFVLLFLFYIIGIGATYVGYSKKKKAKNNQKTRKTGNILGNTLAGLIFACLGYPYGVIASLSAATSDTVSSEIGLLSEKLPISILSGKTVKMGQDGGITLLGTSVMILISILVGLVSMAIYGPNGFLIGSLGGILGSLTDSVLGDAFETRKVWGNNTTNFLATLIAGLIGIAIAAVI
jgi:uncharacterized protein (TIGR00297 family)